MDMSTPWNSMDEVADWSLPSSRMYNIPLRLSCHPRHSLLPSPPYFVRMCLSLPGEYKKLLAYALGVKWRTLGSCTKYS